MPHAKGYSLVELLIALSFTSIMLLTLSTTWLYTQHVNASLNQVRMAEQIVTNIATELLVTQKTWDNNNLENWRKQAEQFLPNSVLSLNSNEIQLTWPSNAALAIHCDAVKPGTSCLAIKI